MSCLWLFRGCQRREHHLHRIYEEREIFITSLANQQEVVSSLNIISCFQCKSLSINTFHIQDSKTSYLTISQLPCEEFVFSFILKSSLFCIGANDPCSRCACNFIYYYYSFFNLHMTLYPHFFLFLLLCPFYIFAIVYGCQLSLWLMHLQLYLPLLLL